MQSAPSISTCCVTVCRTVSGADGANTTGLTPARRPPHFQKNKTHPFFTSAMVCVSCACMPCHAICRIVERVRRCAKVWVYACLCNTLGEGDDHEIKAENPPVCHKLTSSFKDSVGRNDDRDSVGKSLDTTGSFLCCTVLMDHALECGEACQRGARIYGLRIVGRQRRRNDHGGCMCACACACMCMSSCSGVY